MDDLAITPIRWGIPLLLAIFAVGLSRVDLGVHYPSDILAAAIFGALMGCSVVQMARQTMHIVWTKLWVVLWETRP